MDRSDPNQSNQRPMTNVSWYQASELCQQNGTFVVLSRNMRNNGNPSSDSIPNTQSECNFANNQLIESNDNSMCKNKYGVFNLIGNVWEWTRDEQRRQNSN